LNIVIHIELYDDYDDDDRKHMIDDDVDGAYRKWIEIYYSIGSICKC